MELIVCLGLAVSAFVAIVVSLVGLLNAPTPILLVILIAGVMLTQKSINQSTELEVNFVDDKEKNNIEKVELAVQPEEENSQAQFFRSLNYSGLNNNATPKQKEIAFEKKEDFLLYRGVKMEPKSSPKV